MPVLVVPMLLRRCSSLAGVLVIPNGHLRKLDPELGLHMFRSEVVPFEILVCPNKVSDSTNALSR